MAKKILDVENSLEEMEANFDKIKLFAEKIDDELEEILHITETVPPAEACFIKKSVHDILTFNSAARDYLFQAAEVVKNSVEDIEGIRKK